MHSSGSSCRAAHKRSKCELKDYRCVLCRECLECLSHLPPKTPQERHGSGRRTLCRLEEKLPVPAQEKEQWLEKHGGVFVSVACAGFAGGCGISNWSCSSGNSGEEKGSGPQMPGRGGGMSKRAAGVFWFEAGI